MVIRGYNNYLPVTPQELDRCPLGKSTNPASLPTMDSSPPLLSPWQHWLPWSRHATPASIHRPPCGYLVLAWRPGALAK
jgi:hypothetical protein